MGVITKLEYRVRKVDRYIITRYVEEGAGAGSVSERGEFDNPDQAWETAYALCKLEHEQHTDIPHYDERVKYPDHPHATQAA
jgi:hypothetical protein